MKVILLVSSLFYLLGLKISNTIDVFKNSRDAEPIIMEQPAIKKGDTKTATFTEELKTKLSEPDSTSMDGSSQSLAPSNENEFTID